ncbi:MAG: prepilin-type N-terminal cleavage/methylation domain-containing protein [bacterium]
MRLKKLNLGGFTLIELLVVIMIIGVALGISIIKVNSYFAMLRLKTATQDFIQDLQWAEEVAKGGTQTTVIFGTTTGPVYTGTYTITVGGITLENPIWLSQTEKKREGMKDFHLMPNIPVSIAGFSFATTTAFVTTPIVGSLTLKDKVKYVTISRFGKVSERK